MLDELVAERLGRFWDIRRQQHGEVITYAVPSPTGERVELGHSYGLHLWLCLPQGWRADTHDDDLEGLVEELNQYIDIADAVLRQQLTVPHHGSDPRPNRWKISEFDVTLRMT